MSDNNIVSFYHLMLESSDKSCQLLEAIIMGLGGALMRKDLIID